MTLPTLQPAFSAGELAPALWGREDLAKLKVGATTMRNMIVNYRGGAYSRPGTAFVGRCREPATTNIHPRLIPFIFSISQAYELEFGTHYIRFIFQGAYITETPIAVTAFGGGNITVSGSYNNGDWIFLSGLGGAFEANEQTFIVGAPGGGTFQLLDLDGVPVNPANFSAYTSGGTAARIYEIATPYAAADLPLLKFTQSADVMSLTHSSYPPMELKRFAAANWTLSTFTAASSVAPPSPPTLVLNSTATSPPPLTPTGYSYVVTSVDAKTGQESVASLPAFLGSPQDIAATAGSITISWAQVAGAGYYNVYKAQPAPNTVVPPGSLYGYVGLSSGTQLVDNNIVPDFTQVPPLDTNPFTPGQILDVTITNPGSGYTFATAAITTSTGSGAVIEVIPLLGVIAGSIVQLRGQNYAPGDTVTISGDGSSATASLIISPTTGTNPGVVSYFQQRRVFANTPNNPDTLYFSQPGAFNNFDKRIPTVDSDAITVSPYAEQVNGVQWMIAMSVQLVTLTGRSAWAVEGSGSSTFNPQPVSPSNTQALQQAFYGCNAEVMPFRENYDIIYCGALGSRFYALNYNFFTNLYTGTDITVLSSHLFDGYRSHEAIWCRDPLRVAWVVRDDGALISLTYMKEQEVSGWARHDTQGAFWSSSTIPEPPVDAAYFITSRQRPGKPLYYAVERMDNRIWKSVEDPWCIDCGVATIRGEPAAGLAISTTSGAVTFSATAPVFDNTFVGVDLRALGGIARITGFAGASQVTGMWILPPNAGFTFVQAGDWTVARPVTVVSGGVHLAGMTVVGLADGVPIGPFVMPSNGVITLPFSASYVRLGLSFTPQFQSVYLDEGQPTIQGRRKNIFAATVRMDATGGTPMVGSNQIDGSTLCPPSLIVNWTDGMATMTQPACTYAMPPATYTSPGGQLVTCLFSGDVRVPIRADWKKPGQLAIQQNDPLPLNIIAIIPELLPGDLPEVGIEAPGRQSQERAAR